MFVRPLSIGEIFDRSITLFLKNPRLFVLLGAVAVAPNMLSALGSIGGSPYVAPPASTATLGPLYAHLMNVLIVNQSPAGRIFGALFALIGALIYPAAAGAFIFATGRIANGEAVEIGAALRRGFGRWLPMLGTALIWGFGFALLFVGIMLVFVLLALVTRSVPALLAIVLVIAGFAAILLGLAFSVVVQMSFVAVVLDNAEPIGAIKRAFIVGIAHRRYWRSALFGLAYLALFGFFALISLAGEVLVAVLAQQAVFGLIFQQLITWASIPLAAIVSTAFYLDASRRAGIGNAAQPSVSAVMPG